MLKSRLLNPFYLAAFYAIISVFCLELKAAEEQRPLNRRQTQIQAAEQHKRNFEIVHTEFDHFARQVNGAQQLDLFETLGHLMNFIDKGEAIARAYLHLPESIQQIHHIPGIRETVMWPKQVAAKLFPLMQTELERYGAQYGFGPSFLSRYNPHHPQDGILANLPGDIVDREKVTNGIRNGLYNAFGINLGALLQTAYSAARCAEDKATALSRFSGSFRHLQEEAADQRLNFFLALDEQNTACTAGFCGRMLSNLAQTLLSFRSQEDWWRLGQEIVALERSHADRTAALREEEDASFQAIMQGLETGRRETERRQQASAAAASSATSFLIPTDVQLEIANQRQQNTLSPVVQVSNLRGFNLTTTQGMESFVASFGSDAGFVRDFLLVCQAILKKIDPEFPIISVVYAMSQDGKKPQQNLKEMLTVCDFGKPGQILLTHFRNELGL